MPVNLLEARGNALRGLPPADFIYVKAHQLLRYPTVTKEIEGSGNGNLPWQVRTGAHTSIQQILDIAADDKKILDGDTKLRGDIQRFSKELPMRIHDDPGILIKEEDRLLYRLLEHLQKGSISTRLRAEILVRQTQEAREIDK